MKISSHPKIRGTSHSTLLWCPPEVTTCFSDECSELPTPDEIHHSFAKHFANKLPNTKPVFSKTPKFTCLAQGQRIGTYRGMSAFVFYTSNEHTVTTSNFRMECYKNPTDLSTLWENKYKGENETRSVNVDFDKHDRPLTNCSFCLGGEQTCRGLKCFCANVFHFVFPSQDVT